MALRRHISDRRHAAPLKIGQRDGVLRLGRAKAEPRAIRPMIESLLRGNHVPTRGADCHSRRSRNENSVPIEVPASSTSSDRVSKPCAAAKIGDREQNYSIASMLLPEKSYLVLVDDDVIYKPSFLPRCARLRAPTMQPHSATTSIALALSGLVRTLMASAFGSLI
jgi:hypothetical protein